jgi:hypothetical protein
MNERDRDSRDSLTGTELAEVDARLARDKRCDLLAEPLEEVEAGRLATADLEAEWVERCVERGCGRPLAGELQEAVRHLLDVGTASNSRDTQKLERLAKLAGALRAASILPDP